MHVALQGRRLFWTREACVGIMGGFLCPHVCVWPCISTFTKRSANFRAYPLSSVQLLEKQRPTYDGDFPPSFRRCQSQALLVAKHFSELCWILKREGNCLWSWLILIVFPPNSSQVKENRSGDTLKSICRPRVYSWTKSQPQRVAEPTYMLPAATPGTLNDSWHTGTKSQRLSLILLLLSCSQGHIFPFRLCLGHFLCAQQRTHPWMSCCGSRFTLPAQEYLLRLCFTGKDLCDLSNHRNVFFKMRTWQTGTLSLSHGAELSIFLPTNVWIGDGEGLNLIPLAFLKQWQHPNAIFILI